tara:strand:+ start:380 stop:1165 length:786 start_codon:yes stop_codon:yes gene_type:complete
MPLGLGTNLSSAGMVTPGIITDNLVLKHKYDAGAVAPVSDGAASFLSASNNYITMGNPSNLNFGTGSFSIACWAYIKAIGTTSFLMTNSSSASTASSVGYALYLGNTGTDWVFSVGDGTDYEVVETTVTQNANQWYHLCGTFNGTSKQLKLYVDGVLIQTDADTDIGDIDNSDNFCIGRVDGVSGNDWNGYVCNAAMWSSVLTQAQVKSIMWKNYAGLTDSEKTNLVSWWNLDVETNAAGTPGYSGYVGDSHTGNNHGTLS